MLQLTKEHADAGFMTVDGLCAAAIVWSDNTAANLLLGLLDGSSAGPVMFARSGTPSPGSTVPSRT
jgi:beta-lactamase class A